MDSQFRAIRVLEPVTAKARARLRAGLPGEAWPLTLAFRVVIGCEGVVRTRAAEAPPSVSAP